MTDPQPMSTSSAGLPKLAERCEQATGPSYALEVEIWDAIYPGEREDRWQEWLRVSPSSLTHILGPADRDGYVKPRRAFTASLDAAMTLVPENSHSGMGEIVNVSLWDTNGVYPDHVRASAWVSGAPRTYGATPALALCAASLRARASQEHQQ
jgi:hypothetical protein